MKMGKGIPLNDQVTFAVSNKYSSWVAQAEIFAVLGIVQFLSYDTTHGQCSTSQAHSGASANVALAPNLSQLSIAIDAPTLSPSLDKVCQNTLWPNVNVQNIILQRASYVGEFILPSQVLSSLPSSRDSGIHPKPVIFANSHLALYKFPTNLRIKTKHLNS